MLNHDQYYYAPLPQVGAKSRTPKLAKRQTHRNMSLNIHREIRWESPLSLYIYIYTHIYIYIYIYICMHIYICMSLSLSLYIYIYIYISPILLEGLPLQLLGLRACTNTNTNT